MRFHCFLTISFITLFVNALSLAHANSERPRIVFQQDNDLFTGSDRDYTNGIRFALVKDLAKDRSSHNWLQKQLYELAGTESDSFLNQLRYGDSNAENRFSWGIGLTQLMYTPDNKTTPTAPEGERPYAGWLGIECSLHVKNHESASSVTLSIGTTGPNAYAEDAQDWIHENWSHSTFFEGWDSQVPGEMTVNLHFDHKRKLGWLQSDSTETLSCDAYLEWGAALGNFRTDAYVGGLIRAGLNLPETYTTPRVQIGSYGHSLFAQDPKYYSITENLSAFVFVGVRGSVVAHDITLDGPVFRDFDTGVNRKPVVGELLVGFSLKLYELEASFSRTIRSDEFDSQNGNQQYGSLQVKAPCDWPWNWFKR